jgi:riboflavin synthase
MDVCNLGIGAAGYCGKDITDTFTFYQTPEGFIIPKSMIEKRIVSVGVAEGEDAEKLRRYKEEKERIKIQKERERKARLAEIRKKKAEEEERSRDARQLSLFD